ncbi:L-methionine/branched-chain amino acid transporter, partial [Aeromonas sp. HMWF015]
VLLCALVLAALASQVLYAVVLSLGYGCFSLWRRHLRRSRQQDALPLVK